MIATRVGGLREQLATAPQVVMCEPDAGSLARAIGLWLETPLQVAPQADAAAEWRQAASDLLAAVVTALPPLSHPAEPKRKTSLLEWMATLINTPAAIAGAKKRLP